MSESLSLGDMPSRTHLLTPSSSPAQANLCRGYKSVQSGRLMRRGECKGIPYSALFSRNIIFMECSLYRFC